MVKNSRSDLSSEEVFETFRGDIGGVENLFQGAWLDDVLSRNDNDVFLVRHRNVFALAEDIEAGSFEGLSPRVHERPAAVWSCADFDGSQLFQPLQIFDAVEVGPDGILNILQGFFLSLALGDASFEGWAGDDVSSDCGILFKNNWIFHISPQWFGNGTSYSRVPVR